MKHLYFKCFSFKKSPFITWSVKQNEDKCKKEYKPDYIFNMKESIPKCECRGLIRPNIVLYGETLPNNAVNKAIHAISNADMLIIGGTSLQVFPAASFVSCFTGKHLIVINKEEVEAIRNMLNEESDLFIQDSLGNVFSEINNDLNKSLYENNIEKDI